MQMDKRNKARYQTSPAGVSGIAPSAAGIGVCSGLITPPVLILI